eukprot:TRINITY_DN1696_c0_g1_i1.p1 TRINITY_DN1696_c0_g1~~TRINITY_DN1696_c0_g1_i1.p1  ORF type:complete len:404 (+),score=61.99 TRINITY_DN1696_c0_g1_i1:378-1589(+)
MYPQIFARTPEAAEWLLKQKDDVIDKARFRTFERYGYGQNIASSSGDIWRSQRTVLAPAFHGKCMQNYFDIILQKVDDVSNVVDNLMDANGFVNVVELSQKLTIDILGSTIFGFDFNELNGENSELFDSYKITREDMINTSPLYYIPNLDRILGRNKPGKNASIRLNQIFYNILSATTMENIHEKVDIVSKMVQGHISGKISIEEILANMFTLILAGHETTASSLSWGIHELSKDINMQGFLRTELDEVDLTSPNIRQELQRLPYLNAFIKENLRMHPPLGLLSTRVLKKTIRFKDTNITFPKNATIGLNIYAIHRSEGHWENPNTFDFHRFLNGKIPKYCYIPFVIGKRKCMGEHLSLDEQRVFFASVLKQFQVRGSNNEIDIVSSVTVHQLKSLKVQFISI